MHFCFWNLPCSACKCLNESWLSLNFFNKTPLTDYFHGFSSFLERFDGFVTLKGIFLSLVLPFPLTLKAEMPQSLFIFILMEILIKKGEVDPFPLGMQKCPSYGGLSQNFTEVKKKASNFSWPPNNCTFHYNDCRHKSALSYAVR